MVIKNYIILALFCYQITSQEWITPQQPQTITPYLQKEDQHTKSIPKTYQQNDINEVQITNNGATDQQSQEDKGLQIESKNQQVPISRNPFDRSTPQSKKIPPNMDNMSDEQIKQYLESGKDHFRDRQSRREVRHNRGQRKQFKRKHDSHSGYNMQMFCMLGLGVVGTVLFFFCIKKCNKHSKRSMERMMRRRERSRFQQIVAPQLHMCQPIYNEAINSASQLSIDSHIRFHQMELQKLKQFNNQKNQAQRNIPVGQPIYQGYMMRNENFRQ